LPSHTAYNTMRFVSLLLLITVASNSPAFAQQQEPGALVLTGANVVDVAAGTVSPDQTVLVEGNRIVAVGRVDAPPDAEVVDVAGGYVIPGLWDMHAHLVWGGWDTSEFLVAHGITGARDLWGDLAEIERRSHPMTGDTLAPRVLMAGAIVDGAPSMLPGTEFGFLVLGWTRSWHRRQPDLRSPASERHKRRLHANETLGLLASSSRHR